MIHACYTDHLFVSRALLVKLKLDFTYQSRAIFSKQTESKYTTELQKMILSIILIVNYFFLLDI